MKKTITLLLFSLLASASWSQQTVARRWNEVLLQAIRDDAARPTIHARNLYHTSIAMYDAWAAFDSVAQPVLLGRVMGNYFFGFNGMGPVENVDEERNKAISYACYRIIWHRFRFSPGVELTHRACDSLMALLGYDPGYRSVNYADGDGAALGNAIGQAIIDFGHQDGSNEENNYANRYYRPVNPAVDPNWTFYFTSDPNRWQPLSFNVFIDQSGVQSQGITPSFLSPEWGNVVPFALKPEDAFEFTRDNGSYRVYHSPGAPPKIEEAGGDYQWGFGLVVKWSSHLDPADGVMWDISPASIGNNPELPTSRAGWRTFFDENEGGDQSRGHAVNPVTGQPYAPNVVPRGDYTRVLAEFWADGPDSETPPGHWFKLLNDVNDHPALKRRYRGQGPELSRLEWEVKSYLALGGAMHDAAVTAWSIKGWYDYVRPISAVRYMGLVGQRSDPNGPRYNPEGFFLEPGMIESVLQGDTMFPFGIGQIKVKAWRGPNYINNPVTDAAGVGWIYASEWWPYQRPTFVTPPFAGFVSGHSTFSRAAAEVLTAFTGDAYFPGGMAEYLAPRNEYLVFEEGPSVDVRLQWATYRDASDQCSLSRIWGGIHPPCDDIPGRLLGIKVGEAAFEKADAHFRGLLPSHSPDLSDAVFPNPVTSGELFQLRLDPSGEAGSAVVADMRGQEMYRLELPASDRERFVQVPTHGWVPGVYVLTVQQGKQRRAAKVLVQP